MIAVGIPAHAMRRASRVSDEQKRSIVRQQLMEPEIEALLDAHDALIRACVESRLAFGEFAAAYGDFPMALDEGAGLAVLRLFGGRIAFHKRVAGVISGMRGEGESLGSEVGRFMPMVRLMRLRELVEQYPNFRCGGAEQIQSSVKSPWR